MGDPREVSWSIPLVNRVEHATRLADPVVWQSISDASPELNALGSSKLLKRNFPVSLGKSSKSFAGFGEKEFVM